jgi:DNA-binding NtrC family response regulator
MSSLALIVDSHQSFCSRLEEIVKAACWDARSRLQFVDARTEIAAWAPSVVATSLRLGGYNGIHLAYLAKLANPAVTCIVFDEEPAMGREAQHAGAFFECRPSVPFALPRYLRSILPASDRRDVFRIDRRRTFRGGRRATDLDILRANRIEDLPRGD